MSKVVSHKAWIALAGLLMLAGLAWALSPRFRLDPAIGDEETSPRVGFLAPDFTLSTFDDGERTLSELRGKVIVINFWATWCPPCRAEMPALQRAYDEHRGRGLEILAINTTFQDSQSDAREFVNEFGLTFPILLDQAGDVSRGFELRAMPTTLFVDREGYVREVILGGPMSEETIQTTLEVLLKEG